MEILQLFHLEVKYSFPSLCDERKKKLKHQDLKKGPISMCVLQPLFLCRVFICFLYLGSLVEKEMR